MSARTRFNPSGKQQSDEGTLTENSTSVKAGQLAGSGTLQDASNSPKPSRRNVDEGTSLHQKNNERKENEISIAPQKNTTTNLMGIDKPLNIGSLVRPKSKKNDTVNSISQSEPAADIKRVMHGNLITRDCCVPLDVAELVESCYLRVHRTLYAF